MNCPKCGSYNTFVQNTRQYGTGIRRQRNCRDCLHIWYTIERNINGGDKGDKKRNPDSVQGHCD